MTSELSVPHRWRAATLTIVCSILSACGSSSSEPAFGPSDAPDAPRPTERGELAPCGTVTATESASLSATTIRLPPKPEVGERFADPNFGTCISRLSSHRDQPPVRFARNAYSRRQAFNADNSLVLLVAGDGNWHLYDPQQNSHRQLVGGLRGQSEPQWHPRQTRTFFYLADEGRDMKIMERNVQTAQSTLVADLGPRLTARWPDAAVISTRSEGNPSRDFRYWAWLVQNNAAQSLGIVVWDAMNDDIIATRDIPALASGEVDAIDWVSMTPSGQWVVLAGRGLTTAFTRALDDFRVLHNATEHSDFAVDVRGADVYVSIDFNARNGWLFMTDIETGVRTNLISMYNLSPPSVSYTSLHISGLAYERPGWALVSTYRARSVRTEWFQDKVMMVELAAFPRIRRLADHYSSYAGYWTEPHASSNRSMTQVLFNTNWNSGSADDVDTWLLDVPLTSFD